MDTIDEQQESSTEDDPEILQSIIQGRSTRSPTMSGSRSASRSYSFL
jgi:hypothetical protein